jgi:hypothetical protein
MRDLGLPKVLTWRWAPCAALVAGSLTFVGFALLVIPDRIGSAMAQPSEPPVGLALANNLTRTVLPSAPSEPEGSRASEPAANAATNPAAQLTNRPSEQSFPRRGFSPPLERPEPPAPPPPVSTPPAPPAAMPPPPAEGAASPPPPGTVWPMTPPGMSRVAPETPQPPPPVPSAAPPETPTPGVIPQASNEAPN